MNSLAAGELTPFQRQPIMFSRLPAPIRHRATARRGLPVGFTFILVLCLAGVFCLAPLAIYFLWLAFVTRRDQPTVISGPWDFVGLVAGLSGFILFGGGLVLSLVQSNFRYWMRGNFESLRAAWGQEKVTWILF